MATYSDEEIFGAPAQPAAQSAARIMSDAEVFGAAPAKTYSDSEVFGTPDSKAAPSFLEATSNAASLTPLGALTTPFAREMSKRVVSGAKSDVAGRMQGIAETIPLDADEQRKKLVQEYMAPAPFGPGMKFGDALSEAMKTSITPGYDPQQTPLYKAGTAIENFGNDVLKPSPQYANSVAGDIASGVGSLATSIGPAFLGPIGAGVAAATLPFSGSGEAAERARKAGASPEDVASAARWGLIPGATDWIDFGLAKFGVNPEAARGAKKAFLRLVEGGAIEGTQEGAQQFLQNLIAKNIYKPNQSLSEGVAYNAAIGSVVGAGARVSLGGIEDRSNTPPSVPTGGDPAAQAAALAGAMNSGTPAPAVEGMPMTGLERPPLIAPTPKQSVSEMDPAVTEFFRTNLPGMAEVPFAPPSAERASEIAPSREEATMTLGETGVNVSRATAIIRNTMGEKPEDIAPVSIKELFQNSFDAIKDLVAGGQLERGKIDISADERDRSITIQDNGIGMPPSVMGKEFIQVAGTKKLSDNPSGSFGVAKTLPLFGNKTLTVTSMHGGKIHQMITTGPELLASTENPTNMDLRPKIFTRTPTSAEREMFPEGHGTHIKITLPSHYRDPSSGEQKSIPFYSYGYGDALSVLKHSPLFHDIDVTYNGTTLPLGRNFAYRDYAPFGKGDIKFDWGTARIYISRNTKPIGAYDTNVHVLSNGIWQFDTALPADPNSPNGGNVQREIYIDVSSRVKADEMGYPFQINRMGFAGPAKADVGKIMNFLSILYNQQDMQDSIKSWGSLEYLGQDNDGVFVSPPIDIKPTIPPLDTGFELLSADDDISLQGGKLVASGKELPTLTSEDLERVRGVDTTSLRVPQSDIDANGIMLHDNVIVQTSTLQSRSIVAMAREKFGARFDEFMHGLGEAFQQLRDAVADNVGGIPGKQLPSVSYTQAPKLEGKLPFSGLKKEPVGISFDIEYRGVSIRIPFRGAFLNPAIPEDTRNAVTVALGYHYTMIHELAHHIHRSETHLAPWVQRLMANLDASSTFNVQRFKQNLIDTVNRNWDIFQYLNGVMTSGTFPIQPRGKRLSTDGNQQRGDGGSPESNAQAVPGRQPAPGGSEGTRVGAEPSVAESRPGNLSVAVSPGSWHRGQSETDNGRSRNQRALNSEGDSGVTAVEQQEDLRPLRQAVHRVFAGAPGGTPGPVLAAAAHADRMNRFYKWGAGLDQLIKGNPRFFPLLRYGEVIEKGHQEESAIHDAALRVGKRWRGLGKRSEQLASVIDQFANMAYLSPAEVAAGIVRLPTPAETTRITAGLDGATLGVLSDVRSMFDNFLSIIERNALDSAAKIITDPARLIAKQNEIRAAIAEMRNRPYFPFMRFGRHFVMVKDAAGRVARFETFERRKFRSAESIQQAAYQKAKATAAPGEVVTFGVMSENVTPFVGMPGPLLEMIKRDLHLTPAQLAELENIQLQHSPALSFQRLQKSNFTPGYSMDFRRSFSKYFFHGARYYTRTKYTPVLKELIQQAKDVPNDNKAGMIASYIQDHLNDTILDAKGDHGWFKGGIFLQALGYSVYGAAQNLAQMPMVIYPVLAAKFGGFGVGDRRAVFELTKSMTDVTNYYKKGSYRTATEFELKALDYGIRRGIISETQAPQLAGMSMQNNLYNGVAGNALERGTVHFMEKAAWMFEMSEQFLRRSTYRAALRLAQKYPNTKAVREAVQNRQEEYLDLQTTGFAGRVYSPSEAAAMVTAADMTQQANFVYARYARPKFMRGRLAGTVTVFLKYWQSVGFLLGQNKSDVLPRYLLMAALMGGAAGIPGYDEFKALLKFIARRQFGKDFNLDLQVREWAQQLFNGKIPPDIMLHGLARGGFGLPALIDMMGEKPGRGLGGKPGQNSAVPEFDMSRMFSTKVVPMVDLDPLLNPGNDINKTVADTAQRASGAVFSVGFNLYKALQGDSGATNGPNDPKWWGEWKRWEKTMPRALKDASHAYRSMEEGRDRGKGGPNSAATVVPFDVRDTEQMAEVLGMAGGFAPRRLNAQWDRIMAEADTEKYYDVRRKGLLGQMFEATQGRDPEEIAAVQKDIRKFNGELPDYARARVITADTVSQSMQAQFREKNAKESGTPVRKTNIGIARHIQDLFPETTVDVRKVR